MKRLLLVGLFLVLILVILVFPNSTEDQGAETNSNFVMVTTPNYLDHLLQLESKKEKVKMAVVGSSVTKGSGASSKEKSWPNLLKSELKKRGIKSIKLKNFGMSGYKASDLLEDQVIQKLIKEQPQLIIVETGIVNNYLQSISIEETIESLNQLLVELELALPNSLLLVTSPGPIELFEENEAGFYYEDYLLATEDFVRANGFSYVNVYDEMETRLEAEQLSNEDILMDSIHPNDLGYRIWFEILIEFMETHGVEQENRLA